MKILIAPGYGAGWSTWADDNVGRFMLTYQPIIDLIESGGKIERDRSHKLDEPYGNILDQLQKDIHEKFGEDAYGYFGGVSDLVVKEVSGPFRIDEYDGFETIKYAFETDWITPE